MSSYVCPACESKTTFRVRPTKYRGQPWWYRCSDCQTEFLVPQPDDERLAEIYGSAYYEPWGWEYKEVVGAAKAKTSLRALSHARPVGGSRLLDVGCARGEFAAAASRIGLRVAGLDINANAIDLARKAVPEADFFSGELDPDVVGCNWDYITMFDFIEHVRSPREILGRASSMLAPMGELVLSTPRAGSLTHRVSRATWPQYREEHLVLFSFQGLRCALRNAGLEIRSATATTKFTTGAYLLGQLATYSSPRGRELAQRARVILRARAMHRAFPMRFGEMTVVAGKASGPTS